MKYYSYDNYTGLYLGFGEADESPAEPGSFLLPAWATFDVPPEEEGKFAYFLENGWVLKSVNPEVIMTGVVNEFGTAEVKKATLLKWADISLLAAAKALDFKSMDDALTYVSAAPASQREFDANELRELRREVMRVTDALVSAVVNDGAPLIEPGEYAASMPVFRRKFPPAAAEQK